METCTLIPHDNVAGVRVKKGIYEQFGIIKELIDDGICIDLGIPCPEVSNCILLQLIEFSQLCLENKPVDDFLTNCNIMEFANQANYLKHVHLDKIINFLAQLAKNTDPSEYANFREKLGHSRDGNFTTNEVKEIRKKYKIARSLLPL